MSTDTETSILILALDPDVAAQISYRAHSVGFVPFAMREDETVREAAFRLRPSAILVQVGRDELNGNSIEAIAASVGATLVVFGDETPELDRIAKAHGGKMVS